MSKLVLIDGNAILHRAYHALPPTLTTIEGEPINAVYGFTSMLLRVIEDLKPTHMAVCFDRKEPTFRKKAFKEYQAHRPEMDKDLSNQFSKAKAVVEAFGMPIYEKAGFEADDVIGTIAKGVKVDEVNIVTGDKDILQLVDKKVKVYLPVRGLSEAILMGEEEVFAKMGVTPKQIVDYKALVGDPSDNYKGVPGIGPKTAESLLGEFKTFKGVYNNLSKIRENTAEKLKKDKKSADMSYKLAKIVTDVKIHYDIDESAKWRVNSDETLELFKSYSFKTLTKRVKAVGAKIDAEKQMSLI